MLTVVPDPAGRDRSAPASLIDEIVREGARRMLAEALQAEVDAYIAAFAAEWDEQGRRVVVRNGYHEPRDVLTSAGSVQVTAPRGRPTDQIGIQVGGRVPESVVARLTSAYVGPAQACSGIPTFQAGLVLLAAR